VSSTSIGSLVILGHDLMVSAAVSSAVFIPRDVADVRARTQIGFLSTKIRPAGLTMHDFRKRTS